MDITGNALVVGGGSGIGRACAIGLAKDGAAAILVVDMNFDSAKRVAAEFKAVATMASFRTEALHMDVSKADSVEHATNYMVENFGRIDYCINSAGIGVETPCEISEADVEEFSRFLAIGR